ncbi:kinase, putative [Ricinus communis]|uniref:non-specific serine/threonine protein kinase n=1 Tax=Ricinus communis TaxID=3988 RepID=B9SDJ6_RICCO|nr:kinase, putative [Ricinus communis]
MNTRLINLLLGFLFLQPFVAHPFSFNISNFKPDANDIIYEGDATIVDGGINLVSTSNLEFRVGHASYAKDINLWNSSTGNPSDFTTHFSFTVNKSNKTPFSDGFVFFIAPLSYQFPSRNSSGGYLGLFNSSMMQNQIVAVEFDTFPNREWDPPYAHVGINSGSLSSNTFVRWDVNSISGKPADAWISYNATTKNLSVFWTYQKDVVYMSNSTVSYIIDLMKILPQQVKIGFSASTGVFYQQNTITSWQFNTNMASSEVDIPRRKEKAARKKIGIAVGAGGFSLLILVIVIGYILVVRRRRNKNHASRSGYEVDSPFNDYLQRDAFPKRFCYKQLETATNKFADDMRLGRGGSGQVYKGMLNDIRSVVAVKRISSEFVDSEKLFMNEVKIISRLIHRNLVQFIGWCHEQGNLLLVFDYMPNGSLDTHLFGNRRALPWQVRYKIAIDIASAIHYLHEDAGQCVLHRDIKSANVLLDADFTTKLGDFGVAKLVDPRLRTQKTGVVGTYGYLAPEYAYEGRASKESDMFSFGIVALELACGRRTYQDGGEHMPLAKWVWQLHLAGNILNASDERLSSDFNREEMECLLKVGLWCAHPKEKERLKAGQVIKILKFEVPLPDIPDYAHDPTFPAPSSQLPQNDSPIPSMSSSIHLGR